MGFFTIEKKILRETGLLLDESVKEQKYDKLLNVVLILAFVAMVYGSVSYLFEEADSVIEFIESVYAIGVYSLLGDYYVFFVKEKKEMNLLLIALEEAIITSKILW